MTETGNIENIVVSTDGVINARAGYKDTASGAIVADALSDINITLASKLPTEAELNQLRDNEITFDDYIAGYKDMKIGTVNATQNVTLSSERKVVNADANGSSIKVTINAVGDVGSENSALSFIPSKEVAIYTKSGGSVYINNANDLKINRIDITGGETESAYAQSQSTALDKVIIVSAGNITNSGKTQGIIESTVSYDENHNVIDEAAENGTTVNVTKMEDKEQSVPNIKADYISITSGADIGDYNTELYVQTPSTVAGKGLVYSTPHGSSYIKGIGEMKILSGASDADIRIVTEGENNTIIENLVVDGNFTNITNNTVISGKLDVARAQITAANDITINGIETHFGGMALTSTGNTTIANATVGGNFTGVSNNTTVTGKLTATGKADIRASNDIRLANVETASDLNAGGSIDVSSKYVLRHANNVLIRNKKYNSSMENAITEASEATVKNAQFREKTINKTDISLYAVPTVSDYISNVVNGGENADITNIKGDLLNTENVFDAINTEVSVSVTENANESVFTGEL